MSFKKGFTVCISSVITREKNFMDYRFTAKSVIEELGMEAVRNPEDVRTQKNFESELEEKCDFFILILGSTPSSMVEKELLIAISKGISILVFVKTSFNSSGKEILPNNVTKNLSRISPELFNAHIVTFFNCEDLDRKLRATLQDSFFNKISLSPLIGEDPPIAYTEGLKLIKDAKYRIILSQKSSILVLGPRKGNRVEKVFYEELLHWLNTKRALSMFFVHYFSLDETIKAMNTEDYDLREARIVFEELFNNYGSDNGFNIRFTKSTEIVSHLIGDTGLGLNFWISDKRYYLFLPCFMTKDSELQSIITCVQRAGQAFSKKSIPDLYNGKLLTIV